MGGHKSVDVWIICFRESGLNRYATRHEFTGHRVFAKRFPDLTFVCCKVYDSGFYKFGPGQKWAVVDTRSGLPLAYGRTREQATKRANEVINYRGIEAVREKIESVRQEYQHVSCLKEEQL